MRNKLFKLLGCLVLSNAIAWTSLSPRVAAKLYAKKLFERVDDREGLAQLRQSEFKDGEVLFRAVDGTNLQGWFYAHATSKTVILLSMGRSCRLSGSLPGARLMLEAGASVFTYEYRGFGSTPGRPSIDSVCEDGLAAYDYLVNVLHIDPANIVIVGRSLGAGVASFVSQRRPSAGLVLLSGFASLDLVGKDMRSFLKIYPRRMFGSNRLDNAAVAAGVHPPLLIMHSTKDEVISFSHAQRIYRGASGRTLLVPLHNSGHSDLYEKDGPAILAALRVFLCQIGGNCSNRKVGIAYASSRSTTARQRRFGSCARQEDRVGR